MTFQLGKPITLHHRHSSVAQPLVGRRLTTLCTASPQFREGSFERVTFPGPARPTSPTFFRGPADAAQASTPPDVQAGAGSGAGAPPIDKFTGGSGNSDESNSNESSPQAGAKAGDLPKDIQEALAQGKVSDKVLQRWSKYSKLPIIGFLCRICPPFRDRILGNPRFLLVLAIELVVGGSAKLSAEAKYRKSKFGKELNMVASDMALEVIADVTVVWLLSTKVSFQPQSKTGLSRWLSALPAHAFQIGDFTLAQRASNVALRAVQFMAVGFGSSLVGHTITTRMVDEQRKNTPKGEELPDELAPVLPNSLGWGSFMALSANSRYQLINGIEERFLEASVQNPVAKTLATLLMRFTNTYTGGFQWMWYASKLGLQ